eukprot:m51a1_g1069 hypothetical protein (481) ;mRNA; r:847327-848769
MQKATVLVVLVAGLGLAGALQTACEGHSADIERCQFELDKCMGRQVYWKRTPVAQTCTCAGDEVYLKRGLLRADGSCNCNCECTESDGDDVPTSDSEIIYLRRDEARGRRAANCACVDNCTCVFNYLACHTAACGDFAMAMGAVKETYDPALCNSDVPQCYFQSYGDPHMGMITAQKWSNQFVCGNKEFATLYQSTAMHISAGADAPPQAMVTYLANVTLVLGGRTFVITPANFSALDRSSAPKGYIFSTGVKSINGMDTQFKSLSIVSSAGELVTVYLVDNDKTTGPYLDLEIYGICAGNSTLQLTKCPPGSPVRRSAQLLRSPAEARAVAEVAAAACAGLSGDFLAACRMDVEQSGNAESAASAKLASANAQTAATYFTAWAAVAAPAAAAAGGLSAGAIGGIAAACAVAGVAALAGAAVGTAVYVHKRRAAAAAAPAGSSEMAAPAEAAGSKSKGVDVLNPSKQHGSITMRAVPIDV